MKQIKTDLNDILSRNRTEELGHDVWEHFVIPPFFDRIDLIGAKKPRVIIGGRGCGKTMLLRYLSHHSYFSKKRNNITSDSLSHIGLYWRADTQFVNAMFKRGMDEEYWSSAFDHYMAIVLGMEFIESLRSIANSAFKDFTNDELMGITFKKIKAYDPDLDGTIDEIYSTLDFRKAQLEAWVSNIKKVPEPIFLPGMSFLLCLITEIQKETSCFEDAIFHIYIDEYENLREYQQKIINTWLKHSESPMIVHIAMKRNGFDTRQTVGPESLSDVHDMRRYDLEEYMLDSNFNLFASEILLSELSHINTVINIPIDITWLRDVSKLVDRRKDDYAKKVILSVSNLFPVVSYKELAKIALNEKSIYNKIKKKILTSADNANIELDESVVLDQHFAEALVIFPSLLSRAGANIKTIFEEYFKLLQGENNKFSGNTGWIHNNLIGSLLQLYAPYSKACPFYAGFTSFCLLAKGNIRHFLELCHKSIYRTLDDAGQPIFPVDIFMQADAARQVSTSFLGEVRSFGRYGERMHTFVLRLGSLFSAAHRRPSQSEPEITHFSISKGTTQLNDYEEKFLSEAVKWSVLFEDAETKKKDQIKSVAIDYVLNPIYSPYFQISYRKKRKMDISTDEIKCLVSGTLDEFSALLRGYETRWGIDVEQSTLSLFE